MHFLNRSAKVATLLVMLAGTASTPAATITVTSTADNGPGTLRAALASAGNGDTVDASGLIGTITLTTGELLVTNRVVIVGPGQSSLTVNGNAAGRVFDVSSNTVVSLVGLTISNGFVTGEDLAASGAGILSQESTLTLSNVTLAGNVADFGGGICCANLSSGTSNVQIVNCLIESNSSSFGGGLFAPVATGLCSIRIENSTIRNNVSKASHSSGSGGGIAVNVPAAAGYNGRAQVQIVDSTLSGNSAQGGGGAVSNNGNSDLQILNSTFSANLASGSNGGGVNNSAQNGGTASLHIANSTFNGNSADLGGGGLFNSTSGASTTAEIGNTILNQGTASGGTLIGGSVVSRGYNLASDSAGGFLITTGDKINTDAMLGPLQDNGGPTPTHALLPGSPAIDQGKRDTIPALATGTDQRGLLRPFDDPAITNAVGGDGSDIGAFEVQAPAVTVRASDPTASEPGTNRGSFTVRRAGSTTGDLRVFYTVGGTATPGVDYRRLSGRVTIRAGRTSATVAVLPIDDQVAEPTETVALTLSPNPSYTIGAQSNATVNILDND